MVVWVKVEGCCMCQILMKYFLLSLQAFENKVLFMPQWTKEEFQQLKLCNGERKATELWLLRANTFTPRSCRLHAQKQRPVVVILTDMQIPLNTQTTIRSCRVGLKLWSDNVNWNNCICAIAVSLKTDLLMSMHRHRPPLPGTAWQERGFTNGLN